MPLADILIIILLALFALSGIRHGAVWEFLTAVGLAIGFSLTYYYRQEITDLVMDLTDPGWERQWGGGIVFLIFFLIVYLGFTTIGKHLHEKVEATHFKWPDRILGSLAGILKGVVLIALLVMAIEWLDTQGQVRQMLWKSQLVRWGKHTIYSVTHWESPSNRKWV